MAEFLPQTTVVKMKSGSIVYGTSLPSSDIDYKGIFLPSGRDILLQSVPPTLSHSTRPESEGKNRPGDIDTEWFSLQRFLGLIAEGQTIAFEMLYIPEKFYVEKPHPVWREILEGRDHLLHAGMSGFVRYCRTQASKYGAKGNRLALLRSTVLFLQNFEENEKLEEIIGRLEIFVEKSREQPNAPIRLMTIEEKHRVTPGRYLEVCGKKLPLGATVKRAKNVFSKALSEYGARALAAEKNEGVDWKAMGHAVRIAEEAIELVSHRTITYPRPNADWLLDVRQGRVPAEVVSQVLDESLARLETALSLSRLPKSVDLAFIEQLVLRYHAIQVSP